MSVYVDNSRHRYAGMVMCHMLADTTPELLDMADRIGVDRRWLQNPGTPKEHFDICMTKRALAVTAGAFRVDRKTIGWLVRKKGQRAKK